MEQLYTMAEMANLLKTPDSTVRSWCNRFEDFVPYTGEGRERRYLPQALEVLRVVADCYGRRMTTAQIAEFLAREFPRTVSAHEPQQTATTTQQQSAATQQQATLTQQQAATMVLLAIAGYQKMSEELAEIKEKLDSIEQQQTATTKQLAEKVEWAVVELKPKENRPWLGRLLGKWLGI